MGPGIDPIPHRRLPIVVWNAKFIYCIYIDVALPHTAA